MKTFDGYSKEKFSDTSVLLAGGGSKELSNFIGTLNWDSTNRKLQYKKIGDTNWRDLVTFGSNATNSTAYLPLAGGTMTGLLTTTSGGSHKGIKVGNTYINAINGDLIFQNNSTIRFGGDSWDYNVWAGLKYVHSSKIIYLGLADGSAFTANSAQSNGKLYLPGIANIYTGNGSNLVWHAGNDGSGSGLDADMTDGLHVHSGRNNEANKIVRTDESGYIQAGWINTTSGDMETTTATRVYCSNDAYIRYKTLANFSSDIAGQLYWADIKVSTSSSTSTNPTFNRIICNYKSGTWVTSLTSSAISLPDASESYGGWICGPTNAGRIVIGTYQASDNYLYFGYGERGRTTNSFATSMYWDGPSNCLYAAHFYEISDIRFKNILSEIKVSARDLSKLPLFNFIWNNLPNNTTLYSGTSAQEVLKILPTVVNYTKEHYQLDYATLGTIAGITACKELVNLKSEIDSLKERIKELEQQLKMYHGNSK